MSELTKPLSKRPQPTKPVRPKRSIWRRTFITLLFSLAFVPPGVMTYWVSTRDEPNAGRPETSASISPIDTLALENTAGISSEADEKNEGAEVAGGRIDSLATNLLAKPNILVDQELLEDSPQGPLPKISRDGRRAEDVYAQPVDFPAGLEGEDTPQVSIVLIDVGQNLSVAETIMSTLPKAVTLSFSPYGINLAGTAQKARKSGHEIMLQLPLEPFNYPDNDPGPHTLLAKGDAVESRNRLHWVMARLKGYTGLTNTNGGKFLAEPRAAGFLAEQLSSRGLMFANLAPQTGNKLSEIALDAGLSYLEASLPIDRELDSQGIEDALEALIARAQKDGYAVGVSRPYPFVIKSIEKWTKTLAKRGIALVPLSAMRSARLSSPLQAEN